MLAQQLKLGIPVMIETNRLPGGIIMATAAIIAVLALMHIIDLMAINAF